MADPIKLSTKQFTTLKGMRDAQEIVAGRIQSYVMSVLDGAEISEKVGFDIDWEHGYLVPVEPTVSAPKPELVTE